jgi:hypothetical protein
VLLKKKMIFFCFKLIFLVILDCFGVLMSIFFFKTKYYFDAFPCEKHFKTNAIIMPNTCFLNPLYKLVWKIHLGKFLIL